VIQADINVQHAATPQDVHFLIQPGWQNSGPHHWQTLWQERLGSAAMRVPQQDWLLPERQQWVSTLVRTIEQEPRPVVVLAHSVGAIASVFAQQQTQPAAVVLVAPADAERPGAPEALQSFAPIPMQPLAVPSLLIVSDNDPYCSLERARAFAQAWHADLEVIAGGGHLNSDAGFGPWPEGWQMVGRWLKHHALSWPADEGAYA
jgi:predicted alpha/beta hydrolase family esterase